MSELGKYYQDKKYVHKRIKADAKHYADVQWGDPAKFTKATESIHHDNCEEDYIAGATAEAAKTERLIEIMQEVIRISDRKHDAWDRAKEFIQQWKEGKEAPEKFTQFALECAITAIPLSVLKSDGEYFKAGNGKQFVAFRWDKDENNARLSIREDGDTRYVFNGLVTSVDDFKKAWELTVLIN